MDFFENNLKVLSSRAPEMALKVEAVEISERLVTSISRSGPPVPRLGDILIHSAYYPEKESEKFAAKISAGPGDTVVVFGFGFGYHLETVADCGARIIVVEPSAMIVKAAMRSRDIRALLGKIDLVSPERFDAAAEKIDCEKAVWVDHEPSVRLNRAVRDNIADPFMARIIAKREKYKIMVVGPIYGGTTTTARSCVNALKSLGFIVEFVDNTIHRQEYLRISDVTRYKPHENALKKNYSDFLGETIVARAHHIQPDIILSIAQAPLAPGAIDRLKALGAPVVFWFVEDYTTLSYWEAVAPHYDYFFCIQKGAFLEKLAKAGAPFAGYLPQAADTSVHRPVELTDAEKEEYGSDISFMGAGYPNRRRFFSGLLDMSLKIWGTEWDLLTPVGRRVVGQNLRIEPEQYVKIFNTARINLNLHSSLTHPGVDPLGDFINPRTYEIAACGRFQLVDMRGYMAEAFKIDDEMVTFSDIDDLREKISFYLAHPEKMERIATAARQRVLREHTFVHRMARMINIVSANDYENIERAREKKRGINDVDSIVSRTDNPELIEFLEKFKGGRQLSLSKVMEAISEGEGDLTRPEALFIIIDQILSTHQGEET
ncbi:CgeB family protein [hydrothermal vent metagenome]|uniref:CgeB family protein n=1 Tax=hydrothermal vent metagenome TaxID=652676 RepID=A0A3B1BFP8_9ZZZZ